VIVVGAGMSGICMAIKLQRAGITDITVLEKADEVGGTWRDNTYPGLRCDVPSSFYQYTFARNPDWSQFFSDGSEIHRYFRDAVDRFGLRRYIEFGSAVTGAEFVDGRWQVRTEDGKVRVADFLVSATGVLHHPVLPDIPGLDTFEGAAFHSARWDHTIPLSDKRVAVVGTGSTGAQIVTALSGSVPSLLLFQRTAQWVLPAPNWRNDPFARELRRRLPAVTALEYAMVKQIFAFFTVALTEPGWRRGLVSALCRQSMRLIRDPQLRAKLTPDYEPMCKRLVLSGGFHQAVQRPGVEVITEGIQRIDPQGVVTEDGVLHEIDVLVLATGFDSHAYLRPMNLVGPNGHTLEEAWRGGPKAYRTVAIPDFPNFFMLMGPHSPVGNFSLVPIAEAQADYVLRWIESWRRGEFDSASPTSGATDSYNTRLRAAMPGTVWASGCNSWYLGEDGVPEVWPWSPSRHAEMLRRSHAEEFVLEQTPEHSR
jgi:cation diffusion facilitator CzcD-associated flavoprotein CzcO